MHTGSFQAYVETSPLGGDYVSSAPRAGHGRYVGGLSADEPNGYVSAPRGATGRGRTVGGYTDIGR